MNPGIFERIVTLGTKFDWNEAQAEKEAGFLNPDQMDINVPAYVSYLKKLHRDVWRNVVEKTARMMLDLGTKPLLQEDDFKQIRVPVTLMRGTKDKMVSQEETAWVARVLSQAKHIEMEHWQHPIDRIEVDALAKQLIKQVLK